MLIHAVLATAALHQIPDEVRPVIPVDTAPAELGRVMDVEGPWIAALRLLPIPARERMHHAPRRPWELARVAALGLDRVVMASSPVQRGGWGAPHFAAVAPDGGMVASWRLGSRVAVISPAGTWAEHGCSLPRGAECLHVEHDGIIHGVGLGGSGDGRALSWRAVDALGVGEPRELGVILGRRWKRLRVLREGDTLVWVQGDDALATFDVHARELKVVPCAGIGDFDLDGVEGGVLFAHSSRMDGKAHGARSVLRTVNLASGAVLEQPSADPVAAFTPAGWMTATHWVDPAADTRVALGSRVDVHKRHRQVGEDELWVNAYREVKRIRLRPERRAKKGADNRAAVRSLLSILDGGLDEGQMDALLSTLQGPYTPACLECLGRVARGAQGRGRRNRAIGLIASSDAPGAVELLRTLLLAEPEWWNRLSVIEALARVGDTPSVGAIVAALPAAEEIEGRHAERAALALAILGDEGVLPELEKMLEGSNNHRVRAARDWLRQRAEFLEQFEGR